ncbi:LptF/LptG family permease [Hyphococcus flavus]|uniref:LptF/LptG family permease n=1 Tax=Hyphococcus flavus TaxID=1866326 RepID=A0AAE9ZDL9_9PROT|nr:LptF/LptG family permease [Hyphococcus flavus]WDI31670.1 LptF/LptG family permease [Hyphococcus flavus]
MNSLDRYLLRQCITPLFMILLVTTAVVWMTQSLQRIEIIVEYGQGLWTFLFLSLLIIPSLLAIIIPFALFGAVVYALHRLHSDSEIAVMFAAGVSRWRLSAPLLAISVVAALATFYVNVDLMPRCYRVLKLSVAEIRADFANSLIRSGEFVNVSDGLTVYVDDTRGENQYVGLLINDYRNADKREIYMAERAILQDTDAGTMLLLKDGNLQTEASYTGKIDIIRFDDWALNLSAFGNGPGELQLELTERYLGELLNPDMSKHYDRTYAGKLIAEGHGRIASPLYALAYVLVALYTLIGGAYTRRGYFLRVAVAGAAVFGLRIAGFVAQGAAGESGMIALIYAPPLIAIVTLTILLYAPGTIRFMRPKEAA